MVVTVFIYTVASKHGDLEAELLFMW